MKTKSNREYLPIVILAVLVVVALCGIGGSYALGNIRTTPARADQPVATEALALVPDVEPALVATEEVVVAEIVPAENEVVPVTENEATNEEVVVADLAQSADEASDLPSCTDLRAKWENGDWDQAGNVRQALPQLMPGRSAVRDNGDIGIAFFYFSESYPSVTLHRAVPDDSFLQVIYCTEADKAYDLLPLLDVQAITAESVAELSANHQLALRSHSVELAGEQLPQNLYEVYLGEVNPGAFIYFEAKDDAKLGVNDGVTAAVVSDRTFYTRSLTGEFLPIEEMTFFPSEEAFGDVINEEEYAEWLATQK